MQFLTIGNYGYLDFLHNAVANFQQSYMAAHTLAVICTDSQAFDRLGAIIRQRRYRNVVLHAAELNRPKFARFDSADFVTISKFKFTQLAAYAAQSQALHYFDGDVAFLRDPGPALARYEHADVVFQTDEKSNVYGPYQCTGNMLIHNNERSRRFLDEVTALFPRYPEKNDQDVLREYFGLNGYSDVRTVEHVKLEVFDPMEFQHGHRAFALGGHQDRRRIAIHANYRIGKVNKISALMDCGGWFLPTSRAWVSSRRFLERAAGRLGRSYRQLVAKDRA